MSDVTPPLSEYEARLAETYRGVVASAVVPLSGDPPAFCAVITAHVRKPGCTIGPTEDMTRTFATAEAAETWLRRRVAVLNSGAP